MVASHVRQCKAIVSLLLFQQLVSNFFFFKKGRDGRPESNDATIGYPTPVFNLKLENDPAFKALKLFYKSKGGSRSR